MSEINCFFCIICKFNQKHYIYFFAVYIAIYCQHYGGRVSHHVLKVSCRHIKSDRSMSLLVHHTSLTRVCMCVFYLTPSPTIRSVIETRRLILPIVQSPPVFNCYPPESSYYRHVGMTPYSVTRYFYRPDSVFVLTTKWRMAAR